MLDEALLRQATQENWAVSYSADIGRDRVIRHYDVTDKLCPLYFVEHPEAWEAFLADVRAY